MTIAFDADCYSEDGYYLTAPMWPKPKLRELEAVVRDLYAEEQKVLTRLEGAARDLNRRRFFLHDLRLKSPLFADFVRSDPFSTICLDLLGPDVDTHYDGAIIKCAQDGHPIDWHQNEGLNTFGVKNHLTCFTAITPMTEATGCLWMIPGSHRLGKLKHEPSTVTGFCETQHDKSGAIPIEMTIGQVLIIHPLTLHMSGENTSNDIRIGYVPVFQAAQVVAHNGRTIVPTQILRSGETVRE